MSAYEIMRDLLVEKHGIPADAVHPDLTTSELGLDSLTAVEFVFDVEDHFDIEITDEELGTKTLGETATLVDELIAADGE
ncbi:MAG: phosphopantetheine-binding protein [Gemmatimonadota bacterium]|nr:phosphopantetheine-binding protein [Gemmatimonadota bacterium]MDE3006578.1 phosphopantetheine-binding protein [Gemmatimonadota bacterium]MDE3013101.1 phosphopantetheine-binding protein [Gemmatimonadota bacterium]